MFICNDVANLICRKVDNIIDLNKLRFVCKSFNKQAKLYKSQLVQCEFIMISVY